jgi:hypothetical protein
MRAARALAAAALLALGATASAQDGVLLEVQGKDKVLGTLRPAGENETILGTLAAGTTLKAAVKSTQKTGPIPTLAVLFNDAPVAEAQFTTKGRGTVLVPFEVQATGVYKVVVAGDGALDGDYQLAVAWAAQKVFTGTGSTGHTDVFQFSAPSHATASVTVSPAKGSPFLPHLDSVQGPAATFIPLSGGGKARVPLPLRGDWKVYFSNVGAAGAYTVKVVVTAPKPKRHTTDIRDSTLSGAFGGGTLALGAVIDPGEGGLVGGPGSELDGTPLEGSSVQVPPDSLGQATTIYVAESQPYTPPGGDSPAGPAVEFGPPGTEFADGKPAVVTIPFDPDAFPGGIESLVVYVKDQNGDVVAVPGPYTFGPNTVTFTTSHFSIFQSATSAARGLPVGGYEILGIGGAPLMGDSGEVRVTTGFLQISSPQDYAMFLSTAGVHFAPGFAAPTPDASPVFSSTQSSGLAIQNDDSSIDLKNPAGGNFGTLRRGVRDDVMLLEHVPGLSLSSFAVFRRPDGVPTMNTLAGRWHVFVWEFRGETASAGATQRQFACISDAGTATITEGGDFALKLPSRVTRTTQFPGGDWVSDSSAGPTATFSVDVNSDFQVEVSFGGRGTMALTPVLSGDAMFGTMNGLHRDPSLPDSAANVAVFFLVRESRRAKPSAIAGDCADDAGGIQVHLADGTPPLDTVGLYWRADSGRTSFAADKTFSQALNTCTSGYPGGVFDPTSESHLTTEPAGAKWSVGDDGTLTLSGLGGVGAVLPTGDVGVYLRRGDDVMTLGFLSRLRQVGGTKK